MYELLLLILFGAGAGYLFTNHGDGDTEPEPEPDDGVTLYFGSDSDLVGTEYDDAFYGELFAQNISIDALGGDDLIELGDATVQVDIDGGPGDDTITARGVNANDNDNLIDGGDGDDLLQIDGGGGNVLAVRGGEGSDTIDGTGGVNMLLDGGPGDDEILFSYAGGPFTGYSLAVDGGPGDDTLRGDISPTSDWGDLFGLKGGEGADLFDLTVDDGLPSNDDFLYEQVGENTYRAEIGEMDFKPGEDTLIVTNESNYDNIVLDQIELRGIPADPETETPASTDMVFHYRDDDSGEMREVILGLGETTGVTEDDITFQGVAPVNGVVVT